MGTTTTMSDIIRSVVRHNGKTFRYTLAQSATAADLAACASTDITLPVASMRLIAQGKELEPHYPLQSLGEFYFPKNAVIVKELDHNACREWQKNGKCDHGNKCKHAHTHDMEHSPRYVAYENSPPPSPLPTSASGSPPSSAETSPHPSPRVSFEAEPSARPPPMTTIICRNWSTTGECWREAGCHYAASHTPNNLPSTQLLSTPVQEPSGETPPVPEQQHVTLCRHWTHSGECRLGAGVTLLLRTPSRTCLVATQIVLLGKMGIIIASLLQ